MSSNLTNSVIVLDTICHMTNSVILKIARGLWQIVRDILTQFVIPKIVCSLWKIVRELVTQFVLPKFGWSFWKNVRESVTRFVIPKFESCWHWRWWWWWFVFEWLSMTFLASFPKKESSVIFRLFRAFYFFEKMRNFSDKVPCICLYRYLYFRTKS